MHLPTALPRRPVSSRSLRTGLGVALSVTLGLGALTVSTPAGAASLARPAACPTPGRGYGQLFGTLPAARWSEPAVYALSQAMLAPAEDPAPEGTPDLEENRVAAGYTYLGQFIDHDITADNRPNDLTTPVAVSTLVNGRTPQLDLDSVYGTGPTGSPTLYEADGVHLRVGAALTGSPDAGARDLPRDPVTGQAVIGDARNDENRIVAQLHSVFLRYHNTVADRIAANQPRLAPAAVYQRAHDEVVAVYQRIVVNEYLPSIVQDGVLRRVLPRGLAGPVQLGRYTPCAQMPVEFSVAAYRFGHSQVRALYRLNTTGSRLPVFSGSFGTPGVDLAGFSPAPTNSAIEWDRFFPTPTGRDRLQWGYKPDTSITHSLGLLPGPVSASGPVNLAMRNLLRAEQLGLPTGQAVARALGVTPLRDDQIRIGPATGEPGATRAITEVSPEYAGAAPLWTYVLAEAAVTSARPEAGRTAGPARGPVRLGPVGGTIVAETLLGLLTSDPSSILARRDGAGPAGPDRIQAVLELVAGTRTGRPGTR